MIVELLTVLLLLIFGHFLADYPLQGDFLAKAKNRKLPIADIPWYQAMTAHAFIHAGAVFLITHNFYLFILEFVLHFAIDDLKCTSKINYNIDQFLHIYCKVIYVLILYVMTT